MTKLDFALSRRHLLKGASAAAGALGAFGSLNPALAKAPMLGTQLPLSTASRSAISRPPSRLTADCRSAIPTRTTSNSLQRRPTGSCPRISCRPTTPSSSRTL